MRALTTTRRVEAKSPLARNAAPRPRPKVECFETRPPERKRGPMKPAFRAAIRTSAKNLFGRAPAPRLRMRPGRTCRSSSRFFPFTALPLHGSSPSSAQCRRSFCIRENNRDRRTPTERQGLRKPKPGKGFGGSQGRSFNLAIVRSAFPVAIIPEVPAMVCDGL